MRPLGSVNKNKKRKMSFLADLSLFYLISFIGWVLLAGVDLKSCADKAGELSS